MRRNYYPILSVVILLGGTALLIAGITLVFKYVVSSRYTMDIYQIGQQADENGVTIGVKTIYFRPGYDRFINAADDQVLVEGYICNSTDRLVRVFSDERVGLGPKTDLAGFRWGQRDKDHATHLIVGAIPVPRQATGGGNVAADLVPERLIWAERGRDDDGGTFWEIPGGEERQFTFRATNQRIKKGLPSGVVSFDRVQFADSPRSWSYELALPLGEPFVDHFAPTNEHLKYAAFGNGDPTPQCPQP